MNFIRVTGPKDTYATLPAEKRSELNNASLAFFDKYMKAGKCKDWLMLMDGRWVTLWDFDSAEEMARVVSEEPMALYITVDSLPYVDYKTGLKMVAEMTAAAKAAKK